MAATVNRLGVIDKEKTSEGRVRKTYRYKVYDAVTPITKPETIEALFDSTNLPAEFDPDTDDPTLFFIGDYRITKEPDVDVWLADLVFANIEPGDNNTPPTEPGYVELNIRISGQFDDFFRTDATLPADGDPTGGNGGTTDIGGAAADTGGVPFNAPRPQAELNITEITEGLPDVPKMLDFVGTRNDRLFFGAATGRIVYVGGDIRRITIGEYSTSHSFVYDRFYHLVQVPKRDENGEVVLDGNEKADDVFFRQPFTTKNNLSELSTNF